MFVRRITISISALARDALSEYLDIRRTNERRQLPFVALGASGHNTTARDMDFAAVKPRHREALELLP